jgi:hypothetical protein
MNMAGLGLSNQKLRSPYLYYFLCCSVICKIPQVLPKYPRTTFAQNKKRYPKKTETYFGALLYKSLVKNRKTNFPRQAIQEPIFSVANTDFEGGGDGRGCGVRHFFGQIGPTQPYEYNILN